MNAKIEFIRHVDGKPQVIAALISFGDNGEEKAILYKNFDSTQFIEFMAKIDRKASYYDGNIWYEDGTWSERASRYGRSGFSEPSRDIWEYRVCPGLPRKKLK